MSVILSFIFALLAGRSKHFAQSICLVCACFTIFMLPLHASAENPSIEIQKIEHDFGSVPQGVKLHHDFSIKNTGNANLVIRELNPSCGCTAAVLEDPVIPPGKETLIRVTFDTTGFSGEKSKTVRIYSNDPKRSSQVLRIKASIVPEIYTEPHSLEVHNVKKGEELKLSFVVKSTKPEELQVRDVISKSEFISVVHEKNDSGEFLVTATVSPKTPPGRLRSRIVVRTKNTRVPVLNVPVFVDVIRDLAVEPRTLNFGYITNGLHEPIRKVLLVNKAKGVENFAVTKVINTGSPYIKAELVSSSEDDSDIQKVLVDLVPGADGVIRSVLVLETNHTDPDQKNIEIPLYAVVDNEKN